MIGKSTFIHATAVIEYHVKIGNHCYIWHFNQIRSYVTIEDNVSLGKSVYVDKSVTIGTGTRIQNGVSIYQGVHIEPWCFIGPHVVFTNDINPRSGSKTWKISETLLRTGCSIGAGSIIRCGLKLGAYSMLGSGSIVVKSIPDFHISYGNPAVSMGKTCVCGQSRFSLEEEISTHLIECCKEKLSVESFENAIKYIEKTSN